MKIEEIYEASKNFTIRLKDDMNDYEDIDVEMSSEHTNPKSKFFTHCEVKLNTIRHRTIDGHIAYLKTVCEALERLKNQLSGNKAKKYTYNIDKIQSMTIDEWVDQVGSDEHIVPSLCFMCVGCNKCNEQCAIGIEEFLRSKRGK